MWQEFKINYAKFIFMPEQFYQGGADRNPRPTFSGTSTQGLILPEALLVKVVDFKMSPFPKTFRKRYNVSKIRRKVGGHLVANDAK